MRAPLRLSLLLLAVALAASPLPALAQGQIIIVNADGPNEGFNDPTPAAPVGGNSGTTRGQQRLNVFNRAADIWEGVLNPTNDIFVQAAFNPLGTNVLGSAGTTFIFAGFPGAELPDTWYHSALSDQLAGGDLNPGFADIVATFSSDANFYFGFDNNEGDQVDLLPVVLHELGHGLGFANFVTEASGSRPLDLGDIYSQYTLDVTTGKIWNDMTNAERQASAINVRKVSWNGLAVNAAVPSVLSPGEPSLVIDNPASLGAFAIGAAAFGPPLSSPGISGTIVLADDGVGPGSDACTPLTPASAAAVAGNIALVDRGTCTFVVKVANAEAAGAIAVVVADNAPGDPPAGLGGVDPTITIPSGRISLTAGNTIKANLPVSATLGVDRSILAGTDRVQGLMMVAALNPVVSGSSISHYEAVASRNQLMEPAINPDLTSSVQPPEDLTLPLMADIGWFSDADGVPDGADACLGSDRSTTVVIDGCNSGVPNTIFSDGCRISDQIEACAEGATNHGGFVSCVAQATNALNKQGTITGREKGAIQRCAAGASIP